MKSNGNIVVSGFYGVPNVGDEVICQAITKGLKTVFKESRIVVVTRNTSISNKWTSSDVFYLKGFYPSYEFWLNFFKLCQCVRDGHMIVTGGGGIWQDVHSWYTPLQSLIVASTGLFFGIPVCTLGLGVGPIRRGWLRKIVGFLANRFVVLLVRDEYSVQQLCEWGVRNNKIISAADAAPSLFYNNRATVRDSSCADGLVGISLRTWPGINEKQIALFFENLIMKNKKLMLFCCEPEVDRKFYEKVLGLCRPEVKECCKIYEPSSVAEAIASIGKVELFFAMRLHVCILSVAQMVPFIPVNYDPKVGSFADKIGLGPLILEVDQVNSDLAERMPEALEYWQEHKHCVKEEFDQIAKESIEMFEKIASYDRCAVDLRSRLVGLMGLVVLIGIGFFSGIGRFFPWLVRRIICTKQIRK